MASNTVYNITSGISFAGGSPDFIVFKYKKDAMAHAKKKGFKYNKRQDLWLDHRDGEGGRWMNIEPYDFIF